MTVFIDIPSRGNEYWTPEPLLEGQTVFVLGGGPSLRGFDSLCLRGRRVMVVNMAYVLCPWAQFLMFTDATWFHDHRVAVENWPGVVITASRQAKHKLPDKIRRIDLKWLPEFSRGEQAVKIGRSSGHTAISVCIAMGARRVVLLGYDMQCVCGRSHFHEEYRTENDTVYSQKFLLHFAGWNAAAKRAGVEVLNCTPGSALKEFPKATLQDVLR